MYFLVVSAIGVVDMYSTVGFISLGSPPWLAKVGATAIGLLLNFTARRFIVFPEDRDPIGSLKIPSDLEAVVPRRWKVTQGARSQPLALSGLRKYFPKSIAFCGSNLLGALRGKTP